MAALLSEAEKEDVVQVIGFKVGGKLCAADIMSVREILRSPVIKPADRGPGLIEGTIDLRGELVTVIDLRKRLGEKVNGSGNTLWVLIVQTRAGVFGYIVDSVTRMIRLEADQVLPAPDLVLAGLRSSFIKGIAPTQTGTFIVLDFDRILLAEETAALAKFLTDCKWAAT